MIYDVCGCITKRRTRVVSKAHNADVRDIVGKEVLEPEGLRLALCPGVRRVAVESMDGDDTNSKISVRQRVAQAVIDSAGYRWRMQRTYSALRLSALPASFNGYKTCRAMPETRFDCARFLASCALAHVG